MNTNGKTATIATLIGTLIILLVTATTGLGQSSEHPKLVFTRIIFTEQDNDVQDYKAAIFVFDEEVGQFINLPNQYENASWEFAARSKSKPEVWAIAQFGKAGLGPDLEIAHSLDDGHTWKHYSLKKISRFAVFSSFNISKNGRGSLTVQLEDNIDPDHKDGYYTYTTVNGGRTWSKTPSYSKTAVTPATDNSIEQIPINAQLLWKPNIKPNP